MGLRTPVFQVESLTSKNLRKVGKQATDRGLGEHMVDRNTVDMARSIAESFAEFLFSAAMFFRKEVEDNPKDGSLVDSTLPVSQFSKMFWDYQGKNFLIGNMNSDIMTFQTMIEQLRVNDHESEEVLLSLGAGFGIKEAYLANVLRLTGFSSKRVECHGRLRYGLYDGLR